MAQTQEMFSGFMEFITSPTEAQHLWQLPVLLVAALVGAGASIAMGRGLKSDSRDVERVRRLRGIAFALVSAVALILFSRYFGHGRPSTLLHMAISLTLALAVARIGVYALNYGIGVSARTLTLQTFFVRTVWVLFALHVTSLLDPLMDLMQDIGLTIGTTYISLLQVLQAVVVVTVMLVLALWMGGAIERRLMTTDALDKHVRVVVVKLLRGLLVFLGVVIALPLVGIDSTFLSILGGALGVGLGFALQKIASNYVSGFIILMDRSIRMGDVISVDGRQGTVIRLEARCIALSATDGTVFIVPNETFMTQTIVNHTVRGGGVCRTLNLEVVFGSDLAQVRAVMESAARQQSRVLSEPAPSVAALRFTGHGVELSLQFWIADPGASDLGLRSDILLAIHQGLRQAQIAVPLCDGVQPGQV
ncbi:MAG: mechanosensitive ion channel [Betaproteobacteria bacterium]|nr:mechanosensitive ion channel [Betaproteobacteria bacterium]